MDALNVLINTCLNRPCRVAGGWLAEMGVREGHDFDCQVEENDFALLEATGVFVRRDFEHTPRLVTPEEEIEVFLWSSGYPDSSFRREAVTVMSCGRYDCWDAETTLRWKLAMGREKDLKDTHVLQVFLSESG